MDERNEEKKELNNIIETYDGDPDDLVFFQTEQDIEERWKQEQAESIWGGTTLTQPEELVQPDTHAQAGDLMQLDTYAGSELPKQAVPENQGINPEDPHYAYYEPDPYYEYGFGAEPEPVGMSEKGGDDGTGLGVTSMVSGICGILMNCCGLTYIFSLLAIITGICCLCRKYKSGTAKTFSIIGIICGALTLVMAILSTVFGMFLVYI